MGNAEPADTTAFEQRLRASLARLPLTTQPRRWLLALSGGLDSSVLLALLTRTDRVTPIVAVHIDHGLHADSADWSAHCARLAGRLDVGFIERRVRVEPGSAESLEAAARDARYEALAALLTPGDVLLTAHHADDQLETVLLRVLRGTGVRGLTAIHTVAPCGAGELARPLLGFLRSELQQLAPLLGLEWLEDPSNQDTRFDRNFLRARCLPALRERWPHAGLLAERLAVQMAEADSLLTEVAEQDLKIAAGPDPACLALQPLASLSEPRLNNALRHAVRRLDLPVPNAAQLVELRRILAARPDAESLVSWPGAEARVYRDHLYLLRPATAPELLPGRLVPQQHCPVAYGSLELVPAEDYGIPQAWVQRGLDVRYRAGGERFQPYRSAHHRSLKHWLQESGIVPWMRQAVPLLYHGDRLVAVADLCLAADLPQSDADGPFWRPIWTGRPRLH